MQRRFYNIFLVIGISCACLAVARPAESDQLATGAFGTNLNPTAPSPGAFGVNLSPARQSDGISAAVRSAIPNGANGASVNLIPRSNGLNVVCGVSSAAPNGANGVNLNPAPQSNAGCKLGSSPSARNIIY